MATVTIIQPNSLAQAVYVSLSSRADSTYKLYPVVFGLTPDATDPIHIVPVPSGEWNSSQLMEVKPNTTSCIKKYFVDIYVTSTVYPEGDWRISLNVLNVTTAQITLKGTPCLPSERFDIASKRCVAICSCGLTSTEQAPICISIGMHLHHV